MKRDFNQDILDLDGKPFTDKATLKTVSLMALQAPLEGDDKISLDQKLKQFDLVEKIHKGGVVDVTSEDISLIKTRAARCLSLVAVGRLCKLLEQEGTTGTSTEEEVKE